MRYFRSIFTLLIISLFLFSCKKDPASKIPALEQSYATTGAASTGDSLLLLYQAAIAAHPNKHADNLHYLSKAAEIEFLRNKQAVKAVRLLNSGLEEHGAGQDIAEPIGVLARIWRAYKYKATPDLSRNPDDIDLTQANLSKNMAWLDSCLVRLDEEMGGANVEIKDKADAFIEIAEAYSTLVETSNPNKQVDLLMKAANLARTVGDPNTALRFYYNVAEKMPDHPKAPTALFMMAFVYDNDLKDLEKAKNSYEDFLARYPNDPDYADDATNGLKYLGMSPEEIIQQFNQNQK